MVRSAAETFFYNFSESKFFLDESKFLRVPRKVCTIGRPPLYHLKLLEELKTGNEIFMTLYPQKPGTFFGAEMCKCEWKPPCCQDAEKNEREAAIFADSKNDDSTNKKSHVTEEDGSPSRKSTQKALSNRRGSSPKQSGTPETTPPPARVLRMSRNSESLPKAGRSSSRVKLLPLNSDEDSSPYPGDSYRRETTAQELPAEGPRRTTTASETPLETTRRKTTLYDLSEGPPRNTTTTPNIRGGFSRRDTDVPPDSSRRRTTTVSGFPSRKSVFQPPESRRRMTLEYSGARPSRISRRRETMRSPSRSPSNERSPSPPERSSSPEPTGADGQPAMKNGRKSIMKKGTADCFQCRKCAERLCLKCRMPEDLCCCGTPNFLYCGDCESNIFQNDMWCKTNPYKCRKCDEHLCLVCRQPLHGCFCSKPNFFVCRGCESKRRIRCCLQPAR